MKSGILTETLANYKWGIRYHQNRTNKSIAGDIMGRQGHVWISLGTCEDGSVVMLQSTPPGVALYGSQTGTIKSEAVKLAEYYMSKYYSLWYTKYPNCTYEGYSVKSYDIFRWYEGFLPDPNSYRNMLPKDILIDLFDEIRIQR